MRKGRDSSLAIGGTLGIIYIFYHNWKFGVYCLLFIVGLTLLLLLVENIGGREK